MTPPEWTPDRTVDATTAARVIAGQFPALAGLPVRQLAAGWDNVVHRVGEDWVFRFVHREVALPGAVRERAVLIALEDSLPLPIPRPVHLGHPTPEVDRPFWGARLLPGRELADAGVPDGDRVTLAQDLGRFLRALHSPGLAADVVTRTSADGVVLPQDPMGRGDARRTAARAAARLDVLRVAGVWRGDAAVADLLARAETADPAQPGGPVLVHGDLHVRHVLVGRRGLSDEVHVTGVIDWGDVALADAAVDLAVAWAALEGESRAAFLETYGPVPADRELSARVLAVHLSAALAQYAAAEGMAALLDEAMAGLRRAVA